MKEEITRPIWGTEQAGHQIKSGCICDKCMSKRENNSVFSASCNLPLSGATTYCECDHGFSFMDKQLLLTAVRFAQCRLVPYTANIQCFTGSIFPDSSLLCRAAALNMGSHI